MDNLARWAGRASWAVPAEGCAAEGSGRLISSARAETTRKIRTPRKTSHFDKLNVNGFNKINLFRSCRACRSMNGTGFSRCPLANPTLGFCSKANRPRHSLGMDSSTGCRSFSPTAANTSSGSGMANAMAASAVSRRTGHTGWPDFNKPLAKSSPISPMPTITMGLFMVYCLLLILPGASVFGSATLCVYGNGQNTVLEQFNPSSIRPV
jgi:hypothetical protein